MGNGGTDATLLVRVERDFDHTLVRVRVWSVPDSERYPDGVKYAMQYAHRDPDEADDGPPTVHEDGTIVRFDNFPDHPDAPHHHVHRPDGTVEDVDFEDVRPLFERFKREVTDYDEPWH